MAIEKGIPMVLGSDSHSAKYIKCIKKNSYKQDMI